ILAAPNVKQVNLATGVKLRYVVEGPSSAMPIIFLHGITDSSHSWSSTTPFLSDLYRTYALDQRGHGDSGRPLYGYSMAQFAEDAVAFMDKLGIEQAVIVGHSMGSVIAHQIASVYPERVSHLVLVASAPTSVRNEVLTFVWDEIVGLPDFQDPIDPDFIREWQTGPNPVDPIFFEKALEETAKAPARVWKAAFRGLLTDDHTDFLDDVTAPTLIIWGTLDAIYSLADQQSLQVALPGAVFIPYDGAGHNTQWEQPQRV
ncbi:MAG: alpha/beta hydrolase, partial [Actinomycetia bacterium]|nr:alpha/beta hydrolase [Actinomycetes bacterium]